MEYSVGSVGRVVVARLFEGEDLHESVEQIARNDGIRCAAVLITGGFRSANVVVGPKQEQPKIEPRFQAFTGPGEVLGVGTLYWDDAGPKLHIHTAIGKDGESLVGCPRHDTRTFLILEVTIIEIAGITATRQFDPKTGMNLLRLGSTEPSTP
jgi:predicted DNA-binding protein with PD1-like motif